MTKQEYLKARRLVRSMGFAGLRYLRMSHASIMMQLNMVKERQKM